MKTLFKAIKKLFPIVLIVLVIFSDKTVEAQTFQDNLTGEEQGEFPSRWDLIRGSAEVASLNGGSIIYLANKSIITPLINSKNYLSNNFTLEFDAFYDEASKIPIHQYYEVRFWEGHSHTILQDNKGGFYNPLNIYCNGGRIDGKVNGAKVKYDGYRESLKEANNVWRHISISYNNGALKVFIDDILLVNVPKVEFNPTMISIGVFTHEYVDFVRAIKNVRLTGININNNTDNDTTDNSTTNSNTNEQAVDYDYTLPTNDGAPNQILQTDGNGTVNWVDDNHPENNTSGVDTANTNTISSGETLKINDLLDGKSDAGGSSVFLGLRAGVLDDGTDNKNVGVGSRVLILNTTGSANAANGYQALRSNTTGNHNTANGNLALKSNDTGNSNTANGSLSLSNNTFGEKNTANGHGTLYNNTIGNNNTVSGANALAGNTNGSSNTVFGALAGKNNVNGNGNVFIGNKSGFYELSNNKLYIENSNADADNALIYGDFYTNILRTNGELQIGNPTSGGYTFPTIDGSANQTLQTDGNGRVAWVDNIASGTNTSTGETTPSGSEALKINDLVDGKSNTNGSSIYIGINAGLNDNLLNGANIGIGFEVLKDNKGGENTAIGHRALFSNTTGSKNTGIGTSALQFNLDGIANTGIGFYALLNNESGNYNTANGYLALRINTTGSNNTANGSKALGSNSTGFSNTANGAEALYSNTRGNYNTANGYRSLYKNTSGNENTANGYSALSNNTIGNWNTAIGYYALINNIEGIYNTANGYRALFKNRGDDNTAIGSKVLHNNSEGNKNTAIGLGALHENTYGNGNSAFGVYALTGNTTGNNNTAIGYNAQVPVGTASNQVRIGNEDIHYAGVQVPWHVTSDKRWKEKTRELPYGLDVLKQLKPVDYVRKNNKYKTRDMGFIAQDVEALLTKIGYNDQGFLTKDDKGYLSLRYNDFIALLTKAVQEQQEIIENLKNTNSQQSAKLEVQNIKIETQYKNYGKLLKRVEQIENVMNE